MNVLRKVTIATHMPLAQTHRVLSSVLAIPGSRVSLEYSAKVLLHLDGLIPVPTIGFETLLYIRIAR